MKRRSNNTENYSCRMSTTRYSHATLFKCGGVGYLAWAPWGFTPIHNSAGMQHDLIGDVKIVSAMDGRTTMASRPIHPGKPTNAYTLNSQFNDAHHKDLA